MSNRTKALFALLLALGCSVAYAASYNRVPGATFANADAACGNETGMTCWITDCLTDVCSVGGGSIQQMLVRNEGGTWVPSGMGATAAAAGTTSDTFTLDVGGDALVLSPQAGGLTVQRAAAGTVTLTSADDDATAALTVDPGGNAALTLGSASDTLVVPVTAGIALSGAESISNGTAGTITLGRDDAGVVSVICKDDDATAGCTYDAGGAAPIVVGSADVTTVTVTTDGTGNAELVLPDSSVGQDEVGGVLYKEAVFCGDLPNNTTNWASPATGYPSAPFYAATLTGNDLGYELAGTGCAAEDDTTEATADEIMFTGIAAKVHGLYCRVSGSGSNGVVFTIRSAAAGLTPAVTCTVATATTECAVATPTTTDIAANATWAVQAVSTEDLSAQDYWCSVTFSLQP